MRGRGGRGRGDFVPRGDRGGRGGMGMRGETYFSINILLHYFLVVYKNKRAQESKL